MSGNSKGKSRPRRSFFWRFLRLVFVLGVFAVAAAAGGAYWLWDQIHQPYRGYEGERTVTIEPGTNASNILRQLEGEGILRDARLARLYLVHYLKDPPLKAGEYRFDEALHTPSVLGRLIRGEVVTYPLTLIEGLTLWQVVDTIAEAGFGDRDVLMAEVRSGERVLDLDPEAENLEGYLYPDTYHFARGTSEREIIDTLVRTFRQRYRQQVEHLLGDWEGTVRDLVTLASIVEREAQVDEERPQIASVYTNRMRIGMPLQADPTVIYALELAGTYDGNIRRPDLRYDSPYNTYVYPGLPPGPICSPAVKSLVATARPAETPYFYFVSRNDGTHVFSRTLAEHNRNVEEWQRRYWRRRWAEERRAK